jgi:hypothetical protein
VPPQVLAVVERPVGDRNVVNVTSPDTPSSAPRLPLAEDHDSPSEASAARASGESESHNADEEARKLVPPVHRGTMTGALLVVALFVVGCAVLVWANH